MVEFCAYTLSTEVCLSTQGWQGVSMIDLVLVKKDMLRFVQNVRAVRGMGRGLLDHHALLYKVRLGESWWLGLGGLEVRN